MQDSAIYLSRHTFFCLADKHYVFLDLKNDEYTCLGRRQTEEFRDMLSGQRPLDERAPLVKGLLEKGLCVGNEADGKQAVPQRVDTVSTSLIADAEVRARPAIRALHLRRFIGAAAAASWSLRFRSIEETVRGVQRRKLGGSSASAPADVTELCSIFQALRPYYPRPYLCLFDSLALVHFLAGFGVFPQWVYGVRLEPWGAHCWVQHDSLLVNDLVDNVNGYTPIMSV